PKRHAAAGGGEEGVRRGAPAIHSLPRRPSAEHGVTVMSPGGRRQHRPKLDVGRSFRNGRNVSRRRLRPTPWAWVASAWVDPEGRGSGPDRSDSMAVFAVCVHEDFPADEAERLDLLREVGERFRDQAAQPTLWVFPGGYFGFDPRAFQADEPAWPGFDAQA